RFYTALATDGSAVKPQIVRRKAERTKIMELSPDNMAKLRRAMVGVTSAGGTAASAALSGGVALAGKTGTAQDPSQARGGKECDHAWFVGYAPADNPKVVVAVMLECGGHGYRAARIASAIIGKYLGVPPVILLQTEG